MVRYKPPSINTDRCDDVRNMVLGEFMWNEEQVAKMLGVNPLVLEDALLDCEVEKCTGCDHFF